MNYKILERKENMKKIVENNFYDSIKIIVQI